MLCTVQKSPITPPELSSYVFVPEPSGLSVFRRQSNFLPAESTLRTYFSVRIQDAATPVVQGSAVLQTPTEPCVLRTFGHEGKLNTCARNLSQRNSGTDCAQINISEKSTLPNVRNTHSSATSTVAEFDCGVKSPVNGSTEIIKSTAESSTNSHPGL